MFGDGMLFVPGAEENRKQVALAVKTSIGEVSQAFRTGEPVLMNDYGIKKIVAQLGDELMRPKNAELNSSPLYSLDSEGKVLARTPENSLCSYDWSPDWSGLSQALGYRSAGDGSDCKFNLQLVD